MKIIGYLALLAIVFGCVFSQDFNKFDFEFIKEILKNESKNTIISPSSLKNVLAMFGEALEMESSAHKELFEKIFPGLTKEDRDRFLLKSKNVFNRKESEEFSLNIASGLFVDKSLNPTVAYKEILQNLFNAKVERVDFSDAKKSTDTINQWGEQITKGHIKHLLSEDDVNGVVAMLLNGIHFDGKWKNPFPNSESHAGVFFIDNAGNWVKTTFMDQEGDFFLGSSKDMKARILKLYYKNEDFSMIIILPNEAEDINGVLENFNSNTFNAALNGLKMNEGLPVIIPKFNFSYEGRLLPILQEMGINEAFSDSVEVTGFNANSLKLSNVIQKAAITVDEDGTTANVLSAGSLSNRFGTDKFIANKPFLFLIQNEVEKLILFAGKVVNPLE